MVIFRIDIIDQMLLCFVLIRFRPQIDEPSLAKEDVDLSARPERKSLFKGKTFLFLSSKQAREIL